MSKQFKFFVDAENVIEGFRYNDELITSSEEEVLLAELPRLPFKEFEFHGFKGKRRTVSFGWHYEFSGRGKLRKADDIPEFLLPLRTQAAKFARMAPEDLQHVLAIEYAPGAGIGWHRDRPVFGNVIGVSLLAPCTIRFRRKPTDGKPNADAKLDADAELATNAKWERFNLFAEPRSAYLLTGPARHEWEHSILRVNSLRYSVTFRNVKET